MIDTDSPRSSSSDTVRQFASLFAELGDTCATHTLHAYREKTAQAQCDAQCEPRAHACSNAVRKSNACNGEGGDERGGIGDFDIGGDIGRSGGERGGDCLRVERSGDSVRIARGDNRFDVGGACGSSGLPLFSRPFPDERLGLRSCLAPCFRGVNGSATR